MELAMDTDEESIDIPAFFFCLHINIPYIKPFPHKNTQKHSYINNF
jgi:hypothetical protein